MNLLRVINKRKINIKDIQCCFEYWQTQCIRIRKPLGNPNLDSDWICPQCNSMTKFSTCKIVEMNDVNGERYVLPICKKCSEEITDNKNVVLTDYSCSLLVKIL